MIRIRKMPRRGHADRGWVARFHTCSFGGHCDPEQIGIRALRHCATLLLLVGVTQIHVAGPAAATDPIPDAPMKLTSAAFEDGGSIPARYTCDGADVSPPLSWSVIPAGARSLALIISDPDAPDPAAPKKTWTHWVLYNIPPESTGLTEAIDEKQLPKRTRVGSNDWARGKYGGPCPPIGRHRYFHTLYALDTVLEVLDRPTRAALLAAMRGHVLATAELIGTYQRR